MSLPTRTDVTSVKLSSNHILAGIGSYVHVFDKESTKLLWKIHALNGQKIYGLVPYGDGSKVLVFGGKQFTLICGEAGQYRRLLEPVICDDWIHSGVWTGEDTIAILSAHNVVQKWQLSSASAQLTSTCISLDNSILYSGLLLPLSDGNQDVVVFAGTVYSEVIVLCDGETLHRLTVHRGVIFSISCYPTKGILVTTSDDRSVCIWQLNNIPKHEINTKIYWKDIQIICKHEVYGHTARVMRSIITNNAIVSVGEDSGICFWDFNGIMLRKLNSHQNAPIWSLDSDEEHLVTGGGDCGIILHPMTLAKEYGLEDTVEIDAGTPKKVLITARKNIVVLNDDNELIYYNFEDKSNMVHKLDQKSTYKQLSISSCKQLIAVCDMNCKLDVFAENCKGKPYLQRIVDAQLNIGKVMFMQWAGNRHLVFCSEDGVISVLAQNANGNDLIERFILPKCKERWLTSAAVHQNGKLFLFGDRCGNLHVCIENQKDPIKTFSKVHGRYGPTSISVKENEIISTGRDGTIKLFSFDDDMTNFTLMSSKELEFSWVETFLDKNETLVCGFHEREFVVYNLMTHSKVLEVPCGGGHRSWDAIRYFEKINNEYEECIKLIYLKNADIKSWIFQLSKIASKIVVNGSHSKEINCMKTYKTETDKKNTFYFTGGEDTTFRISSVDKEGFFQDVVVSKHLSSVRALRTVNLKDNKVLLLSAGGRAQICIKIATFETINNKTQTTVQEIVNHMVKGTDKERKGNQTWRNCTIDFDPETRIMDLDCIEVSDKNFIVFTGCSDACIRIFHLSLELKQATFKPVKEVMHHKTCILKTKCLHFLNKDIFISCTTRGEVTFWNVNIAKNDIENLTIDKILSTTTNKSGINGLDVRILPNSNLLVATSGDDNTIHLNVLKATIENQIDSLKVTSSWETDKLHSSQITAVILLDGLMVSASIDQRVTVYRYKVDENDVSCQFLNQVFSDVADIHGMEVVEKTRELITVCVYGNGMQVIGVPID